jgi:hypothetical protein
MQLPQQHQMVLGMEANVSRFARCPEFSKQPQQVREEEFANASRVPSVVYPLSHDCICDKHSPHSPNCDRRHEIVGLRDLLMSLMRHSKHIDHHREQR